MYAGGAEHPLRQPCRDLLDAVVEDRLQAETSAEVIQEILNRFVAIGRRAEGARMAAAALDLFSPVLPITDSVMRLTRELVPKKRSLSARDLVHVATCVVGGIGRIVSPERAFDEVDNIERLSPQEAFELSK